MDSSRNVVHKFPALTALFGSDIPESGILVSILKFLVAVTIFLCYFHATVWCIVIVACC